MKLRALFYLILLELYLILCFVFCVPVEVLEREDGDLFDAEKDHNAPSNP